VLLQSDRPAQIASDGGRSSRLRESNYGIIVMAHGEIIEESTHDALMAQGGHYADLYNTYFRHQSLAYVEHFKEIVTV